MSLLVVSSCTKDKKHRVAGELIQDDFRSPGRLARREQELRHVSCPAVEMYTGKQHLWAVEGLGLLRRAGVRADLAILSAGYGLIAPDRVIAPYNVTFARMGPAATRRWACDLGIPAAVRTVIQPYPLVVFLLGDRYLTAVAPPVPAAPGQRLVFLARPRDGWFGGPGVTLVRTGKEMYAQYHANEIGLKGAMFRALARTVAADPEHWLPAIQADETGTVVQQALARGRPSK